MLKKAFWIAVWLWVAYELADMMGWLWHATT